MNVRVISSPPPEPPLTCRYSQLSPLHQRIVQWVACHHGIRSKTAIVKGICPFGATDEQITRILFALVDLIELGWIDEVRPDRFSLWRS